MTWITCLFKCLPSPVGLLSLAAPEPLQSVRPTADSRDSFVTTDSSNASKDCPVGFVSVVRSQFSAGSSIFRLAWAADLSLSLCGFRSCRLTGVGSLPLGHVLLTLPLPGDFRKAITALLFPTDCWLTTDRTSESFLNESKKDTRLHGPTWTVPVFVSYLVDRLLKGLACSSLSSSSSSGFSHWQDVRIYTLFSHPVGELARSGSTRGAFFQVLEV